MTTEITRLVANLDRASNAATLALHRVEDSTTDDQRDEAETALLAGSQRAWHASRTLTALLRPAVMVDMRGQR